MPFMKLFQRYCEALHRKPLLIKSLTSAALLSIADSIAQWASWGNSSSSSNNNNDDDTSTNRFGPELATTTYNPLAHQDFRRTSLMMLYAALCVTPFAHHWYRLLDKLVSMPAHIARWSPTAAGVVLRRVFLDQLIAAPIFISGMFATRGLIAGASPDAIGRKLRDEYLGMFTAGLMVWPSAQCLNMWFIPLQFRVLFNNCVGLGWSVFSSTSVRYNNDNNNNNDEDKEEQKETTDLQQDMRRDSKPMEEEPVLLPLPQIFVMTTEQTPAPLPQPLQRVSSSNIEEKSPRTMRQSLWQNRLKNKLFVKANTSPMPSPKASPRPQRSSNRPNIIASSSANGNSSLLERMRLGLREREHGETDQQLLLSSLPRSQPNEIPSS